MKSTALLLLFIFASLQLSAQDLVQYMAGLAKC